MQTTTNHLKYKKYFSYIEVSKYVHVCYNDIGLAELLTKYPGVLKGAVTDGKLCTKDLGERKRLRKWSRGHQFIIRAGGHTDMW